jgi:preprotein translocase subunit SecE
LIVRAGVENNRPRIFSGVNVGRLQKKKRPADKKAEKKEITKSHSSVSAKKPGPDGALAKSSGFSKAAAIVKKKAPPPRKVSAKAKAKAAAAREKNVFEKAVQFLREARVELKKVVWPSRKQTINSTVVVVIFAVICSFFLGFVDICLSFLLKLILKT